MSSDRAISSLRVALCLALLPSCGLFGSKGKSSGTLTSPNTDMGCVDELGAKVRRFIDGEIEDAEWSATFDCVSDKIDFFKRYVKSEYPTGYSQADIDSLVRRFLITSKPLSPDFVRELFEVKATLFGGDPKVFSPQELDRLVALGMRIRTESLAILPTLREKRAGVSRPLLERLADQLSKAGENLGAFVGSQGGAGAIAKESYLPFFREILQLSGGDPTIVDRYGDFIRNAKRLAIGGSVDRIDAGEWPRLFREGATLGGLFYVFSTREELKFPEPNGELEFDLSLVLRAQTVVNRILADAGGAISLDALNPVIQTMPLGDLGAEKLGAIQADLPNILFRFLKGHTRGWIDSQSIRSAVELFRSGVRGQTHVESVYRNIPETVTKEVFTAAARKYQSKLATANEQAEVEELITIAKSYRGLFPEEGSRIVLSREIEAARTRNHMVHMSWFRKIIQYAFSIYATGPKQTALPKDLAELTKDYFNILKAWKMANPALTPDVTAVKRFREANLFMPSSNGDTLVDLAEGTYYLSFLFSSSSLSHSIYDDIIEDRHACPIVGVDVLGQPAMDPDCFRKEYFGRTDSFWGTFPGLRTAYKKMSADDQKLVRDSMEMAARGKIGADPIGPYDIDSFAALPHYVEDIMDKYDVDGDGQISKTELLSLAYPDFKLTLSTLACKNKDWILEAALTYLVKYGRKPNTVQLLAWAAWRPFWKIRADRTSLYRVIALLSEPSSTKDCATNPSLLMTE